MSTQKKKRRFIGPIAKAAIIAGASLPLADTPEAEKPPIAAAALPAATSGHEVDIGERIKRLNAAMDEVVANLFPDKEKEQGKSQEEKAFSGWNIRGGKQPGITLVLRPPSPGRPGMCYYTVDRAPGRQRPLPAALEMFDAIHALSEAYRLTEATDEHGNPMTVNPEKLAEALLDRVDKKLHSGSLMKTKLREDVNAILFRILPCYEQYAAPPAPQEREAQNEAFRDIIREHRDDRFVGTVYDEHSTLTGLTLQAPGAQKATEVVVPVPSIEVARQVLDELPAGCDMRKAVQRFMEPANRPPEDRAALHVQHGIVKRTFFGAEYQVPVRVEVQNPYHRERGKEVALQPSR